MAGRGRPSQGYAVSFRNGRGRVRFRWAGRDYDRALGVRENDPRGAAEAAARIHAEIVSRPVRRRAAQAGAPRGDFARLTELWGETLDGELDPETARTYEGYVEWHWLPFFGACLPTDATAAAYVRHRLGVRSAGTVRKEASALRRFCAWAAAEGHAPPVTVPSVPKRATGKVGTVRRRVAAPPVSVDEVDAFLAALPEWSTSPRAPRFPIQSRFIVAYETGLRPSTLDALEAPRHYRHGGTSITLTDDADKARWGRRVQLTERARQALDAVCPRKGPIFGRHDYRPRIRAAAVAAFGKDSERAETFIGAHLRSAAGTHMLDAGAPLTGVQAQLGHKHASTTARYIRATERAARAALDAFERARTTIRPTNETTPDKS